MIYTKEVENMCPVAKGAKHEPAPIPEEGKWVHSKKIEDISGFTLIDALLTALCIAVGVGLPIILFRYMGGGFPL